MGRSGMRIIEHLSPTALGKWEFNRENFYMRYLSPQKPPHEPQTPAMAVGSAFDAHVKSWLHHALFGENYDPKYGLDALMEDQVDEEIRDEARVAGRHVFEAYKFTGAYDELLAELGQADDVGFEFTATGEVGGVPIKGKPDCRFIHASGAHVILDWKVSGYYSKRTTSPKKLYARVRDGQTMLKPSRNDGNPHKGYKPLFFKGLTIGEHFLEDANPDWADQLAIYGWMTGEEPGTENLVARIDQITAKPSDPPLLRVANQRARISKTWQLSLVRRLQNCWKTILSGHIFPDMSREESEQRCGALDMMVEYLRDGGTVASEGGYRK